MKLVLQAFRFSIAIHIVYFVGMMLFGYIQTRNYKADFTSKWDNVETLQSKVDFSVAQSPFLYLITFVGVAVIYLLYKKSSY